MILKDKFDLVNARSKGYDSYGSGLVPFVSNGVENMGVLGFVTPLKRDRVFREWAVCVSSFCEATIHEPPFLPRGNGGSGLIVLLPKTNMGKEELYFYAVQINKQNWRFSFGRMVTAERLKDIPIVEYNLRYSVDDKLNSLLPKFRSPKQVTSQFELKAVKLIAYCDIHKKSSTPLDAMKLGGPVPYVTTTSKDNGVLAYVDEKPNFTSKCITVALNGSVGEAFFQIEDFITGGDNAVLTLKRGYNPYLLFYIACEIRRQKWRYNYYRKLSIYKLRKMQIFLPFDFRDNLNLGYIENLVKNSYGYDTVKKFIDFPALELKQEVQT